MAPFASGQHDHAQGADGRPEDRSRSPGESKHQAGATTEPEHLCNEDAPAFVRSNISGIEEADYVNDLRQSFKDQSAQETNLDSHQEQDEIYLQHSQPMADQIVGKTGPKRSRHITMEIEQLAFNQVND